MNDKLAELRQWAIDNPLISPELPEVKVIHIDNGDWAVGLTLNR